MRLDQDRVVAENAAERVERREARVDRFRLDRRAIEFREYAARARPLPA
jgi:hypothetical protein